MNVLPQKVQPLPWTDSFLGAINPHTSYDLRCRDCACRVFRDKTDIAQGTGGVPHVAGIQSINIVSKIVV